MRTKKAMQNEVRETVESHTGGDALDRNTAEVTNHKSYCTQSKEQYLIRKVNA